MRVSKQAEFRSRRTRLWVREAHALADSSRIAESTVAKVKTLRYTAEVSICYG